MDDARSEMKVDYQNPDLPVDEKFRQVQAKLRPGRLGSDSTILEVRRRGDSAVVLIEHPGESKPLGLVIGLADTSHEFYYSMTPVASFDEWVEYLDVYVMVSLDTGVAARSSRTDRGDYVEICEDV